ncbi:MAG: 30S ribosomal protein S13 [Candidatus Levybacteria bacterium GW2011_GWA2_37_36]|nr:MAG: 30S ribosomal protein S13 [Candidatus Levybacteria bacterium GW2011_GWA1_37_16]KKQ33656.1 MAG: 30S ribosomal protein S13 [Candidatus Levybacteria bacterium GW2011_GWA2_37_36]KKQ37444.1 MAG: 30S ribosomal protein S13 [Candidatus Levybacteria bacterium GW2011_GWC2_37_7]
MRIAGYNLQDVKRVDVALTYIYGIGRKNVVDILKKAEVDSSKRVNSLSEDEQKRIQKALEGYKLEGDLRAEVHGDIKRLKEIGSYRGSRHSKNLPVRGQRTRSNARTKRGKRVTIGAIKKEESAKTETKETKKETK